MEPDWVRGLYLTDGSALWWVARVDEARRTVFLENARYPSLPLVEVAVSALAVDGFRVVEKISS